MRKKSNNKHTWNFFKRCKKIKKARQGDIFYETSQVPLQKQQIEKIIINKRKITELEEKARKLRKENKIFLIIVAESMAKDPKNPFTFKSVARRCKEMGLSIWPFFYGKGRIFKGFRGLTERTNNK